jgi:hypothetical protein
MNTNTYKSVVDDIKKRLRNWDYSKAKERAKTGETASREDLINDFLAILGFKRENDDLRYEYSITVKEKKRKADIVILDGKASSFYTWPHFPQRKWGFSQMGWTINSI